MPGTRPLEIRHLDGLPLVSPWAIFGLLLSWLPAVALHNLALFRGSLSFTFYGVLVSGSHF